MQLRTGSLGIDAAVNARLPERWLVMDLCSRKIVGWSLADHLRADLVIDALNQALGSRRTLPEFIFHSDRGSQYGSGTYRELLRAAGMRQSMSARANP